MLFYLRGIIPARAGFTVLNSNFLSAVWDHPRSRGVYDYCVYCGHVVGGSSPLARGLRIGLTTLLRLFRIIPARAGFTNKMSDFAGGFEDHPRSRGVYALVSGITLTFGGSSPLARGLPGNS